MLHLFRPMYTVLFFLLLLFPLQASGFSFSEYEQKEEAASMEEQTPPLSELHCPTSLQNSRIATMIGEMHRDDRRAYLGVRGVFLQQPDQAWDERFGTTASVYGPLVDSLNSGFQQLGLTTYTAAEIQDQIAQTEQEAVLNNDIDAAMEAAKKLQADYMLKGIISSHAQTNRAVKVDEVFLTIELTLSDKNGRQVANTALKETVFSDADIPSTVR